MFLKNPTVRKRAQSRIFLAYSIMEFLFILLNIYSRHKGNAFWDENQAVYLCSSGCIGTRHFLSAYHRAWFSALGSLTLLRATWTWFQQICPPCLCICSSFCSECFSSPYLPGMLALPHLSKSKIDASPTWESLPWLLLIRGDHSSLDLPPCLVPLFLLWLNS